MNLYLWEAFAGRCGCRPARCIVVCKDTDDGIAVVVGEFFAENDLSAERIFVERSTLCVDDCVFHRNCDLRDFLCNYHSRKRKGMLEHCLDRFLPKTKPKPDQNPTSICEKEKTLFSEHRKNTGKRRSRQGKADMEETAIKDRRRKNCCVRIKKESRANLCSALCVLSENFFPLRRRLFLVGC